MWRLRGVDPRHRAEPPFSLPAALSAGLTFNDPRQLLSYLALALFLVVLAMLYTRSFYGLTSLFHQLPLRPHFKPMIGAFLTGAVAVALYYGFGEEKRVLSVLAFGRRQAHRLCGMMIPARRAILGRIVAC